MISPSKFQGLPWEAWTNALGRTSPIADEPPEPTPVDKNKGCVMKLPKEADKPPEPTPVDKFKGSVMKLPKEDMKIFGICPEKDPFLVVMCETCGMVIKPQALLHHFERRHSNRPNDSQPSQPSIEVAASEKLKIETVDNKDREGVVNPPPSLPVSLTLESPIPEPGSSKSQGAAYYRRDYFKPRFNADKRRSLEKNKLRKNRRSKDFNVNRDIAQEVNENVRPIKDKILERKVALHKFKAKKEAEKKSIKDQKKPPFVVGIPHYRVSSLIYKNVANQKVQPKTVGLNVAPPTFPVKTTFSYQPVESDKETVRQPNEQRPSNESENTQTLCKYKDNISKKVSDFKSELDTFLNKEKKCVMEDNKYSCTLCDVMHDEIQKVYASMEKFEKQMETIAQTLTENPETMQNELSGEVSACKALGNKLIRYSVNMYNDFIQSHVLPTMNNMQERCGFITKTAGAGRDHLSTNEAQQAVLVAKLGESREPFTLSMKRAMREAEEIREQNLAAAAKAEAILGHTNPTTQILAQVQELLKQMQQAQQLVEAVEASNAVVGSEVSAVARVVAGVAQKTEALAAGAKAATETYGAQQARLEGQVMENKENTIRGSARTAIKTNKIPDMVRKKKTVLSAVQNMNITPQ